MKKLLQLSLFFWALHTQAQEVRTVSEMRKVMMGEDLSAHLFWDTVPHEHLFGISPLGRIAGEITIIDGQIFTSTVNPKGKIKIKNDWDVRAPFGVFAHVPEWEIFDLETTLQSETDLQNAIENLAKNEGYDLNEAFPFRVFGTFDRVDFHIISKPQNETEHDHELHDKAKKHFSLPLAKGEILGFYSQNHIGVFTHRGTFTHCHFLDESRKNMGHLEKIVVSRKVKVQLPKRPNRSRSLRVNDTGFSKGRLGHIQNIELQDVVKFHGHLCDGLIVGWLGLQEALKMLYPDGTVDRTNTRVASKPSPCLTDMAIYLTGGRYQFNTFYVGADLPALFVVQRIDNQKTIAVSLKKGILPDEISRLGKLAVEQKIDPCGLDELRKLEDDFSDFLLKKSPMELFEVQELTDFEWSPVLKNDFPKTDILNKNQPACGH